MKTNKDTKQPKQSKQDQSTQKLSNKDVEKLSGGGGTGDGDLYVRH